MSEIHKQLGLHQVEVTTKASPDLHPDVLSAYQDELLDIAGGEVQHTDASYAYGKAHDALAHIYSWHADVTDAEKAFAQAAYAKAQYTGRNLEGRHNTAGRFTHGHEGDVYSAALDAMVVAANRVEANMKELRKFRDQVSNDIAKEMDAPDLKTPFGVAVAQSTWAQVQGMKPSDRGEFIRKAIAAGDRLTVMSILNAPEHLTGLGPITDPKTNQSVSQRQLFRDHAANTWAPKESRHLRAMDSIIDKVERSAASMMARVQELSKTVGAVVGKEKAANKALAVLKNRKAG
jgi:hypothetical protein